MQNAQLKINYSLFCFRFENRTLAEPVRAKFGKSIVQLFAWPVSKFSLSLSLALSLALSVCC